MIVNGTERVDLSELVDPDMEPGRFPPEPREGKTFEIDVNESERMPCSNAGSTGILNLLQQAL